MSGFTRKTIIVFNPDANVPVLIYYFLSITVSLTNPRILIPLYIFSLLSFSFILSKLESCIQICITAVDCLSEMMNGNSFVKVKASGRQFRRFFYLEEDLSGLRWMPSSKKSSRAKCKNQKRMHSFRYSFLFYFSFVSISILFLSDFSFSQDLS